MQTLRNDAGRPPPPVGGGEALNGSGSGSTAVAERLRTGSLPIPAGTRIRKYVDQRLLGKGGMGAVYRGHHRLANTPVVIKGLYRNLMRDEDGAKRFVEQARVMAGMRHPNIVRFMNFFNAKIAFPKSAECRMEGGRWTLCKARARFTPIPLSASSRARQAAPSSC